MNKTIADQWVKALRSGVYKQGSKQLKYNGAYCCLGVLCEISKLGDWESNKTDNSHDIQFKYFEACNHIPVAVKSWSGVQSDYGEYTRRDGYRSTLAGMNDRGIDFETIADAIEANWEDL